MGLSATITHKKLKKLIKIIKDVRYGKSQNNYVSVKFIKPGINISWGN
jgi:hypothetical protein